MIYILLPAFNEEKSLDQIFKNINKAINKLNLKYQIVICDDGSTDQTDLIIKKNFKQYPIKLISHNYNRGLGETIRDLFEYVIKNCKDEDILIRMDCDNSHDPETFTKMLKQIKLGSDVVIASRFVRGGSQVGVSNYRKFISKCANLFMKFFFPIKNLKEYSSGFRAYKAEIIKKAINIYGNNFIQIKGLGFTCTLEKIIKLKIIGAKFSEIPFTLRYDLKLSDSKMITSLTTFGYITLVILYYWPFGGWRNKYKAHFKQ